MKTAEDMKNFNKKFLTPTKIIRNKIRFSFDFSSKRLFSEKKCSNKRFTELNFNNKNNVETTVEKVDKIIQKLYRAEEENLRIGLLLESSEIKFLCNNVIKIFKEQNSCLKLESPINICGDLHGQFKDLLRIFDYVGEPGEQNYLFLGDYVDRGKKSIETICLLFCYKIKYKNNFYLLRGNHECASLNRQYGFYDECKRKYNIYLWKKFIDVFNYMPFTAILEERIILMHGGLSPYLENLSQLREFKRPTDIPDQGLLCDIVWSDPEDNPDGWALNDRGVSFIFNERVVD